MRNTFQTWGEFLDFAENRVNAAREINRLNSRGVGFENTSFTETHSLGEALTLARNGWPEGEAYAKPLAEALFNKVSSLVEREEMVHDVVGNSVDVGAYLNDDPECWTRMETHIADGNSPKIFRIVYNTSISYGIDKQTIIGKGAAIAALIKALEYAGHRAEVWTIAWCMAVQSADKDASRPDHETRVLVKSAEQDLDFGRLVFALAHPSTPRRLGFACFEADPIVNRVARTYGYPCDCSSDRGDIYIGKSFYGEPQWRDAESVIAWILETLKTQGVTIRTEA